MMWQRGGLNCFHFVPRWVHHQLNRFLVCLCIQWVCVPFLLTNPHSLDISLTAYNETFQAPWVGTVQLNEAGKWFDDFMLLVSSVG